MVVSQQAQASLESGDAQAAAQRLAQGRDGALQLTRLFFALLEPGLADGGGGVRRQVGERGDRAVRSGFERVHQLFARAGQQHEVWPERLPQSRKPRDVTG